MANAADVNELLIDAVLRRKHYIELYSNGLQNDVIALLDKSETDLRAVIEQRLEKIMRAGFDHGPDTTARLKTLANAIKAVRAGSFDEAEKLITENLKQIAPAEAHYMQDAVNSVHEGIVVETVLPTATKLATIVRTTPFQGKVLKDWAAQLAQADLDRIMAQIVIGLTSGETIPQITKRVVGTGVLKGADGVTEITRNNAVSIVRTAVSTISNKARDAYFQANDDIFTHEVYLATLDSRTTPICRSLDGNVYPIGKGPHPPIHWRCRSVRVALIGSALAGTRPAKGDAIKVVAARTTYQQFLSRQSAAFQDEVLGDARGKLFRNGGLTLDRFVAPSGKEYTLDQLKQREPDAFKRAGL